MPIEWGVAGFAYCSYLFVVSAAGTFFRKEEQQQRQQESKQDVPQPSTEAQSPAQPQAKTKQPSPNEAKLARLDLELQQTFNQPLQSSALDVSAVSSTRSRSGSLDSEGSILSNATDISTASVEFKGTDKAEIAGKLKRRIDRLYKTKEVRIKVNPEARIFNICTYDAYETDNAALIKTLQQLFHHNPISIKPYSAQDDRADSIDLPWEALSARQVQEFRRLYAKNLYPKDEEAQADLLKSSDARASCGL